LIACASAVDVAVVYANGKNWMLSHDTTSKKCSIHNVAAATEKLDIGTGAVQCTVIGAYSSGNDVFAVVTDQNNVGDTATHGGWATTFSTNPMTTDAVTGQAIKLSIPATGNPTIAKWQWLVMKRTNIEATVPTGIFPCGTSVAIALGTITANDLLPKTGSTEGTFGAGFTVTGTTATLVLTTDLAFTDLSYQGVAAATDAQCAIQDLTGAGVATLGSDTWTLQWKGVDKDTRHCYVKKGTTKYDIMVAASKKCIPVALYVSGTDLWVLVNSNDAVSGNADATTGVQKPAYDAAIVPAGTPTAVVFSWDTTANKAKKATFIISNTAANVASYFYGTELSWCNANVLVRGFTSASDAKLPAAAATNVFAAGSAAASGYVALASATLLISTSSTGTTLPTTCTFNIGADITEATVAWNVGHTQHGADYSACTVKRGTATVNIQNTSGKKCQAIGLYIDGANIFAAFNTDAAPIADAQTGTPFTGAPWATFPTSVTTPTAMIVKLDAATGKIVEATYLAGKSSANANTPWTATAIAACSSTHVTVTGTSNVGTTTTNVGPGKAATETAWVAGVSGVSKLAVARDMSKIDEAHATALTTCTTSGSGSGSDDEEDGDDEESAGVLAIANAALAFLGLVYMF
jgi:hypothetical protein